MYTTPAPRSCAGPLRLWGRRTKIRPPLCSWQCQTSSSQTPPLLLLGDAAPRRGRRPPRPRGHPPRPPLVSYCNPGDSHCSTQATRIVPPLPGPSNFLARAGSACECYVGLRLCERSSSAPVCACAAGGAKLAAASRRIGGVGSAGVAAHPPYLALSRHLIFRLYSSSLSRTVSRRLLITSLPHYLLVSVADLYLVCQTFQKRTTPPPPRPPPAAPAPLPILRVSTALQHCPCVLALQPRPLALSLCCQARRRSSLARMAYAPRA